MKWRDVSDADLNGALAAVMYAHDPVAAKNLIEYFYERIHHGEGYNERILHELLNHAFGKVIEENWTLDRAFGFGRGKGQRDRPDHFFRDVQAAAYVVLLRRAKWNLADAIGEAANLFISDSSGDKAVEAAYSKYKVALAHQTDSYLKSMLPEGAPVKSRNLTG